MMTIDQQVNGMSESELDALPLGIIRLDRDAKILYYSASQAEFARRDAAATIGSNFFRDVAPCAAVKAFQGRFNDFVAAPGGSLIEPFEFEFRFTWGLRRVTITLIRSTHGDESFFIVVAVWRAGD